MGFDTEFAFESMFNADKGPYYDSTILTSIDNSYHYEEYGLKFYSFMDVWWSLYLLDTYAAENYWTVNFFDTNVRQVLYWNRPLYSKIVLGDQFSSLVAATATAYDLYVLTYKGTLCEKISTIDLSLSDKVFNKTGAFTLDGVTSYNQTNIKSNCWDAYPLTDKLANYSIPYYGTGVLWT